ncbi:MAG: hypothetical protein AB7S26_08775 [Sandaracinaceae bacterium]
MHTRAGSLALLFLAALVVGGSSARADLEVADELRAARHRLTRYDLAGGTAEVLADLTRFIEHADGADLREARFLRAAVATDLLLLSLGEAGDPVRADVARALGAPEAQMFGLLDRELERVSFGVYAEVAEESRWVLRTIQSGVVDPDELRTGRGERRDMLFVHAVVDAIGAEDDISRLAAYGTDSCGTSLDDCPIPMFAASGRRAVDALREANDALTRLERIAAVGEPLVQSMAAIVAADGAVLRTCEIHPTPRFDSRYAVHGVGTRGTASHPELLVVVEPTAIHYSYVPGVRVGQTGIELSLARTPALPSWASVPLRDDHRTAVVPYEDLEARFRTLQEASPHGTVGLAARADVSAFTMSRVFASLEHAGMPTPELVSRGLEDEARAVQVRVVDEDDVHAPTALYVRLGGFSVRVPSGRIVELPRLRGEDGLRFDLRGLETLVADADAAERPASLRYMSSVEWGTVVDAAFHMRPRPESELLLQIR